MTSEYAYRFEFAAGQARCASVEGSAGGCGRHVSCVCAGVSALHSPSKDETVLYRIGWRSRGWDVRAD